MPFLLSPSEIVPSLIAGQIPTVTGFLPPTGESLKLGCSASEIRLLDSRRSTRLNAHPHKPTYRLARHEAADERQKLVEAAHDLYDAPVLQRSQASFHDLLCGEARQLT